MSSRVDCHPSLVPPNHGVRQRGPPGGETHTSVRGHTLTSVTEGTQDYEQTRRRRGLLLGMSAYVCWGFMPLVFAAAGNAGSVEIIAHRILWSLVFCVALVTFTRGFARIWIILRDPKLLGLLALAGVVVGINWLGFVFGVQVGRVVEISLGYFINPLVTVLLGVIFLGEKLRPLQWTAMGAGLVAVLFTAFAYGQVPWLAFLVAGSFGTYGLIKSKVGGTVGAVESLTVETLVLSPFALGYLIYLTMIGQSTFFSEGPWHTVVLLLLGPVTAIPLLLFGAAARRVPLSWIGMMQYIAPIMQFILGVAVFGEAMPPERWVGFAMVWAAIVLLSVDMVRQSRARPAAR